MAKQARKTDDKAALQRRLFSHKIGPADAALTFTQRLARENRWSADYAKRVIIEYYRFCYLAMTSQEDVTPSDQVDQAWHLHLTYTRDYWQRFCPDILGGDLHHGPTAGGSAESDRYYAQYAQTLALYEQAFEEQPPADIWPPAAQRFGSDPFAFRVNPHHVFVMSRFKARTLAVGVLASIVLVLGLVVSF